MYSFYVKADDDEYSFAAALHLNRSLMSFILKVDARYRYIRDTVH